MEFSNPPIDLAGVPRLDVEHFVTLDPAYLRVQQIGHAGFATAVVVAGLVVAITVDSWIPLALAAALLAATALSLWHSVLSFRHSGWQVRQHDVSYRDGVLVRKVQTLPFVRIQHARITHGPIDRRFGLATLHINSAGPDLAIAGLGADDAERLRSIVIERAGELVEAP